MALHDNSPLDSDQRAECSSGDLNPQQLEELRDSAVALADAHLRCHRKLRELVLLIEHRIDAEIRLCQAIGGQ